jgi:hypothetical protein
LFSKFLWKLRLGSAVSGGGPNVSVTIVLMVMLMLVLARMLIFRTLVKRSTVHNNGDGDVNVRNDVKRSRKCLVL